VTFNLSKDAVLIRLTVGCWNGIRAAREVSEEMARRHGEGTVKASVQLLRDADRKPLQKTAAAIRSFFYSRSLPFEDGGWRIIRVDRIVVTVRDIWSMIREYDIQVADWTERYRETKKACREKLCDLFDFVRFPSKEELLSLYHASYQIRPIATADMFDLPGVPEWSVGTMRNSLRLHQSHQIQAAQADIIARLRAAVENMATRLGKDGGLFRDSLISNIKELCDTLPDLNLTRDAHLDMMISATKKTLCDYNPEQLRVDGETRKEAARMATRIVELLDKFNGKESHGSENTG
jgi:hypothetical protein